MTTVTDKSVSRMHFIVTWKSDNVSHEEHYHASDVNMWRDIFPEVLREKLVGSNKGEVISHVFNASEIVGKNYINPITLSLLHWQPHSPNGQEIIPRAGRYYPQGFLRGVSGVFPQTITPMRIIAANPDTFTVDLNHPLNGRNLEVKIEIEDISSTQKERGGRCNDRLMDMLDNGPGMQARIATNPITFDLKTAYQRPDTGDDKAFYSAPRMVSHIDNQAKEHLVTITAAQCLQPGSKVLDLMASVDSHLPENHGLDVTGLGMNSKEMTANKDLAEHVIYDLNEDPVIPFHDRTFDAVLCNLSIEYLIQPEEILRETARVLKNSGTLLVSFSNRWFPPKVTRLWTELHEFERMGYVLQLCWPFFENLYTYSYRNWSRPMSDKHFPDMMTSDPLYVVIGKVRA